MTQQEFHDQCLKAIAAHHSALLDGPLLVATRTIAKFSLRLNTWEKPVTEYAATIAYWPISFHDDEMEWNGYPEVVIASLCYRAKQAWQTRQDEPQHIGDLIRKFHSNAPNQ